MMITPGKSLPSFSLADQDGKVWTNADLAGRPFVLYFYPKDDTSGCTTEACEFRDALPDFGPVQVLGVSPDDEKSHAKFIKKYSLNFPLLADPEKTLLQELGIWVEKSMYGKKYMGVERTTILVDERGIIREVWNMVKPAGHAAEVLAKVESL